MSAETDKMSVFRRWRTTRSAAAFQMKLNTVDFGGTQGRASPAIQNSKLHCTSAALRRF